ncbi:MAG: glycosyltransferase [Acidobacteriota bacterium]
MTIQLPVYNEPNVVSRLLEAAANLHYPGALDIQLLDDSTDETTAIAVVKIDELRRRGIRVSHVRRQNREGFKAGALAAGMSLNESELFLIFDADFVPSSSLLMDLVPRFADAGVGMVQARWAHLNRHTSLLTRVQSIYLDAHFAVESAARFRGGRFFNFNGTAGMWRRRAIEDAGGWSASTLTEDLDLSYRAQLAGWRFEFLADVTVPSELPASLSGFQDQQHRWAKGSIQTARKILPQLFKRNLTGEVRTESFFHLTNNCSYLLTLVLALLFVPAVLIREKYGLSWTFAADATLFFCSTVSVLRFYIEGQRRVGNGTPSFATMLPVIPLGIGISVRNTAAVLEGLTQRGGFFQRTPKSGSALRARLEKAPRIPWTELMLAGYFAVSVCVFVSTGNLLPVPFLLLFFSGFAAVSALGMSEWSASETRSFPGIIAQLRRLFPPAADESLTTRAPSLGQQ